jgi:hypothetical protein
MAAMAFYPANLQSRHTPIGALWKPALLKEGGAFYQTISKPGWRTLFISRSGFHYYARKGTPDRTRDRGAPAGPGPCLANTR